MPSFGRLLIGQASVSALIHTDIEQRSGGGGDFQDTGRYAGTRQRSPTRQSLGINQGRFKILPVDALRQV